MNLNTVTALRHPRSAAEITDWSSGVAWLAGGTWLFSEPQPVTDTLIDLGHLDWPALLQALPGRRFAFSTKATTRFDSVRYLPGDVLIFGPETRGLPGELLGGFDPRRLLRLPMVATSRSLNLSNAVAVVVYEAWRQNGFAGTEC